MNITVPVQILAALIGLLGSIFLTLVWGHFDLKAKVELLSKDIQQLSKRLDNDPDWDIKITKVGEKFETKLDTLEVRLNTELRRIANMITSQFLGCKFHRSQRTTERMMGVE